MLLFVDSYNKSDDSSKISQHTPVMSAPPTPDANASDAPLPRSLDDVDRRLITLLQANARASTAQLARRLGVARTTVVARLARLESSGVIVGYTARLGGDAAGAGVQAWVGITVSPKAGREVVRRLAEWPEVRQLASVSGEFDYLALLQAGSTGRLDALLDQLGDIDGVIKTTSSVVLALRIDRLG
jgi:DNA-binding Lrp family transcriptional regulator